MPAIGTLSGLVTIRRKSGSNIEAAKKITAPATMRAA